MWFIGLLVGAFIGAMGDTTGMAVGGAVGLLVGAMWSQSRRQVRDARIAEVEQLLERVQARLEAVERQLGGVRMAAAETAATPAGEEAGPREGIEVAGRGTRTSIHDTDLGRPVEAAPAASVPPAGMTAARHVAADAEMAAASPPSEPPAPSADPAPSFRPQPDPALRLWQWLAGGNPFVRVGVVVLFFGVAFLVKYAAEHAHFPIELRLASVAAGAVVMLAVGWRLRLRRPAYALILQGGGIGVLFLTVFAAYRLYSLLPPVMTFALLILLAVFCALLAVLQDSRALAVAGVSGGFLAPVLASTGAGSHVMLFSYYAVLNLGILGIAWFKAWRVLNVVGFVFTFVIGAIWGARFYRPELFASTEPFLVASFLFYVAIALLFARRQALALRNYVDGTVVFGTPLVAFLLQARLVHDVEFGMAYSAVAASLFYLVLAAIVFRREQQGLRLLVESFLALGIVFATLAIPLAFDARVTAASWALEGAAIVWVSLRQRRTLGQCFGAALQLAAGAAFILADAEAAAAVPVANSACLGALMIALGGLVCAYMLSRVVDDRKDWRHGIGWLLFVWGASWWCGAGLLEIERFVASRLEARAMLVFLLVTCGGFSLLARRLAWNHARYVAYAGLPVMVLFACIDVAERRHPFEAMGYVVWPFAAMLHLWLLWRHEDEPMPARGYHAVGLWLFSALAAWQLGWMISDIVQGTAVWRAIAWALVPALVLWVLATRAERIRWPLAKHLEAYLRTGAAPIALFVWGWSIAVNFMSSGDPAPLPYLPLLNPLDLAQVGAFLAVAAWIAALGRTPFGRRWLGRTSRLYPFAAATVFIWLNGVLLRTLHHWAGVPFTGEGLAASMLVQASLSIFWTSIALCVMVAATRGGLRTLWMAGAGLMGAVIAKLFFVDLSSAGGIERIVSFMGVGLLLLVVGYFSPVPPRQAR